MSKGSLKKSFKDYTLKELIEVQQLLSKKETLSPKEASVWLEIPLDGIYKLIKSKRISAFHPFNIQSRWLIDVAETKKLMRG